MTSSHLSPAAGLHPGAQHLAVRTQQPSANGMQAGAQHLATRTHPRLRSGWYAGSVGAWLLGLLVVVLALPCIALADATPVQMILVYMPNVSNTATPRATGIAELVMPEGEVRVTAAELPRLEGAEQYVVWVVNSETNQFQRIGSFNSAADTAAVHYENVLPDAIPNNHWNLLLVTIEASADATRPGARHSIAGVFPKVDNQPLPGLLPNTGGDVPEGALASESTWPRTAGLAALTLTLGAAAGYGYGKRRKSHTS